MAGLGLGMGGSGRQGHGVQMAGREGGGLGGWWCLGGRRGGSRGASGGSGLRQLRPRIDPPGSVFGCQE